MLQYTTLGAVQPLCQTGTKGVVTHALNSPSLVAGVHYFKDLVGYLIRPVFSQMSTGTAQSA